MLRGILAVLLAAAAARAADTGRKWYSLDDNATDIAAEPEFDLAETTRAAVGGDARAMALLGYMYNVGMRDVPQDAAMSQMWWARAAEAGDLNAAFNVATAFDRGTNGVSRDYVTAAKWYTRGAEGGDAEAMLRLGYLYEKGGNGLPANARTAFAWYKKAGELGSLKAQAQVGWYLYRGNGVAANGREAVRWTRRAAEQGEPTAMFNLGNLVRIGADGSDPDPHAALMWYERAAAAATQEHLAAAVRDAVRNLIASDELSDEL